MIKLVYNTERGVVFATGLDNSNLDPERVANS